MKLNFRKLTTWLVIIAMLLAIMPSFTLTASALSIEPVITWNIGKTNVADVVAKLYTNATDGTKYDLVISGTGEMDARPWGQNYLDKIVSLTVEEGVTNICSYAFNGATALKTITFADSVEELGYYAFMECTSLTSVDLNKVKKINTFAFSDCTSLSQVNLGTVETMVNTAFQKCTSLEQVHIPATVTTIEPRTFAGCKNLSAFTVANENATYSAKDGVLFSKDGKTLKIYPYGNEATSYTVPETVTTIGDYAFYTVPALEEITIPNHETTVGTAAIYRSSKTTIKAHNNSPAKTYADDKASDIVFVSICTYDNVADTSCNVCQYGKDTHSHPICGAESCTTDHNLDGTSENHGAEEWTAWNGSNTPSGNVYLNDNITISAGIWIMTDTNLCLNGKTIHNTSTSSAFNIAEGVTLTICDCKGDGKISSDSNYTMNVNGGTLNMYGGTIEGKQRVISKSGSSSVNPTANIYGGTVCDLADGAAISIANANIYGGNISGNGYAALVNSSSYNLKIYGGTLTGGTYGVRANPNGFEMSGAPTINGSTADIYIGADKKIKITGAITSDDTYSVERPALGTFTEGGADYIDKFTSSKPEYIVMADEDGNLKLAQQFTVSFDANGGSGTKDSIKVADGENFTLPQNPFTAPEGKQFKAWNVGGNEKLAGEIISINANTTVTAVWEDIKLNLSFVWNGDNCTIELDSLENDVIIRVASYSENIMEKIVRFDEETMSATLTGDTIKVFYWRENLSPIRQAVILTKP